MTSSVTDSSLLVGRVLDGRYRVLSHIADGGMATVYLALDQRLDREVAVKVMHDNLARDTTFVSRFRREARSAARLSHPNVVAVYDQGQDGNDIFLAMEYVPGRTLRDVLTAEGPLTPRAALDLFDPILQAVAAAHDAGLIHRDVKPENVILRGDGQVKVADFGLARAVTAATTTNASGTLLGTVAYLSPEQVERGIADARSDVYATGLVLYEMLTGRKAFDGDSPIHVAYQHVHGTVPMPSQAVRTVPQGAGPARRHRHGPRPRQAAGRRGRLPRRGATVAGSDDDDRARPPTVDPSGHDAAAASRPSWAATSCRRPPSPRVAAAPGPAPRYLSERTARRRPPTPAGLARRPHRTARPRAGRRRRAWWFTGGPGSMTRVPSIERLTQAAAQTELQRADLRSSVTEVFDESAPAGTVMTANPAAGAEVRKLPAST